MYHEAIPLAVLFCFITSSIPSIAIHYNTYRSLIATRLANVRAGMPESLRHQIEFVTAHSCAGDPVLILSDLGAGTVPVRRDSPAPGRARIWRTCS